MPLELDDARRRCHAAPPRLCCNVSSRVSPWKRGRASEAVIGRWPRGMPDGGRSFARLRRTSATRSHSARGGLETSDALSSMAFANSVSKSVTCHWVCVRGRVRRGDIGERIYVLSVCGGRPHIIITVCTTGLQTKGKTALHQRFASFMFSYTLLRVLTLTG